jgi:putative hemolysin
MCKKDIAKNAGIGISLIVFSGSHPLFAQNVGMPNPAAVYCEFLGFKYEIRKAKDGSKSGVCKFPDGTECDAFAFFRGECGKKYPYCALKGCTVLTQ